MAARRRGPKKKGGRPWNWRPAGSGRINTEGYAEVKVREPDKWQAKHTLIWEAANGKVPKGHTVIFADGNRQNLKLTNLLLVSRSELAVMNRRGLIFGNAELTRAGKQVADLKMLIAVRKKKKPPRKGDGAFRADGE
ncbi:MAG: HNH endonuclease [Spirochaetaceae bacterium]|nr:HNH endonuclease [Spirochaetaceae bacterium]